MRGPANTLLHHERCKLWSSIPTGKRPNMNIRSSMRSSARAAIDSIHRHRYNFSCVNQTQTNQDYVAILAA